jgi:type II restriction/modification system DNA methylase subunit YeeA
MKGVLGHDYVARLRRAYQGRVPGAADFVMYWFAKAHEYLSTGSLLRFGLVATNSVRQKTNRSVIVDIQRDFDVFDAWSDEVWVNQGAAVQVSLICVRRTHDVGARHLDGKPVDGIYADLTPMSAGKGTDFTKARRLPENVGNSFFGLCLAGKFWIPGDTARQWLVEGNPHGRPNSDVLRPLRNGADLTERARDRWVIDFGARMDEKAAALYEYPFEYISKHVAPEREGNNRVARARYWWRHGEARPAMRELPACGGISAPPNAPSTDSSSFCRPASLRSIAL